MGIESIQIKWGNKGGGSQNSSEPVCVRERVREKD